MMISIIRPDDDRVDLILVTCVVAENLHFVVSKRLKCSTLGYRVGRVKIVGLDGQVPTSSMLSLRLAFGLFGPLNWSDSIWPFNDKYGQALRGKFAGTYMVKIGAQPAGEGKIVWRVCWIGGWDKCQDMLQIMARRHDR